LQAATKGEFSASQPAARFMLSSSSPAIIGAARGPGALVAAAQSVKASSVTAHSRLGLPAANFCSSQETFVKLNPTKQRQPLHGNLWAVAAACAIASLLVASAPAGAQGWSAPTQLNTNDIDKPSNTGAPGSTSDYHPYGPSVSLDAAGNASAAWAAWILKQRVATANKELWSASTPATGALTSALVIPTVVSPDNVSDAQVKTDDAGNSTLVWLQFDGTATPQRTVMLWSDKPAGGAWSVPVRFSTNSIVLLPPKFSMNSRGDAVLTWIDSANANADTVMYAVRKAGGTWSAPAVVVTLADAGTPSLQPVQALMGESGDALISWEGYSSSCVRSACFQVAHELHVARLPNGANTWQDSGKLAVPSAGYLRESRILLDSASRAGVVFRQRLGAAAPYTYNVRASVQQAAGQVWSAPVVAASGAYGGSAIRAGNDDSGNVTVVTGEGLSITGSLATNAWTAPSIIVGLGATNTLTDTLSLSVSRNGAAVIAGRNLGAIRPTGSNAWGAVATLASTISTNPFVPMSAEATAINPSGKAVVIYRDWDSVALTYRLFAVTASNTGLPVPPVVPPAPSALTAVASSSAQINLTWTDNASATELAQYLERCAGPNCANFALLGTLQKGVTTYADLGLAASTAYSYRLRAHGTDAESGYSNVATATTLAVVGPPAAPSALSSTVITRSSVALAWKDNSSNEAGFVVQRCRGQGCSNFAVVGTSVYSYRVQATNAYGTSAYSNVTTVKTLR
jgi:hypothetical protein